MFHPNRVLSPPLSIYATWVASHPNGRLTLWSLSQSLLVDHPPYFPFFLGTHFTVPWYVGVSMCLSFTLCDLGISDICHFLAWGAKTFHPLCPRLFSFLLTRVQKLRVALGPTCRRCQRHRVEAAWGLEWKLLPNEEHPHQPLMWMKRTLLAVWSQWAFGVCDSS